MELKWSGNPLPPSRSFFRSGPLRPKDVFEHITAVNQWRETAPSRAVGHPLGSMITDSRLDHTPVGGNSFLRLHTSPASKREGDHRSGQKYAIGTETAKPSLKTRQPLRNQWERTGHPSRSCQYRELARKDKPAPEGWHRVAPFLNHVRGASNPPIVPCSSARPTRSG